LRNCTSLLQYRRDKVWQKVRSKATAAKQMAPRKTSATDLHYRKALCNNSSTETQIKHNRIFVEKPVMWLNKALLRFTVNQGVNLICFRQHGCATLFESDMFESLKWLTAYLRLFAPTRCEHWEDKRELSSPCV